MRLDLSALFTSLTLHRMLQVESRPSTASIFPVWDSVYRRGNQDRGPQSDETTAFNVHRELTVCEEKRERGHVLSNVNLKCEAQ